MISEPRIVKAGEQYRASAPQHRMSALQDLLAGRPLEVNETLGYALERAQALRVATPMLDCFRHLIAGIDRARRAPPA